LITSGILGVNVSHSSRHGALVFQTHNGSSLLERMRIDKDGNVGIGTDGPGAKLHIYGSGKQTLYLGSSNANRAAFVLDGAANGDGSGGDYAYLSHNADGSFDIKNLQNNSINLATGTSGTTRMTITSGGNVGIGTTSPIGKLEVIPDLTVLDLSSQANGSVSISNNSNGAVATAIAGKSTLGLGIYAGTPNTNTSGDMVFHVREDDNTDFSTLTNPAFQFRRYANNLMTILRDGKVGIGTTNPTAKLDVRGDFRLNGAIAQYSTAANSTVLNRFWNNTGGILLAELALYDFGTSLVGGQLSFGEGISKYATLRGTNTDGGKLTLETTSSSTNVIINGNGDTVFNETGAAFDFRIEGDVDPNLFFVDGSADKIGVGTSNPASKLQIVSSTSGDSVLKVDGTNGTLFEVVDDLSDSLMSVNDAAGLPVLEVFADSTVIGGRYNQNDFYIDGSNGRVGIGTNNPSYNLEVTGTAHVTGTFTAGTKSFLINHPTKEDHMLQYGSLEGPEYGVYVRGKTDLSEIELPEVWINLVHEGSITVSFTPRGKFLPLFLNKIENNTIYVGGTEGGVFYDYVVYGTRKDVDDLVTEFTK